MVTLTIDEKVVTVEAGTTILDAAARVGVKIPTLCWLQKVSPTGACRVCAVEIEGVGRPMTACNTPVKEGIRVTTSSDKLLSARRKMVELLLVNHPLDCPVCDAAGECDLQDICYDLGVSRQEYSALLEKRAIRYDWSLLESDPNRCILCEKCVKVDHEVVGADAITVVNCGEAAVIDTVDGGPLNCEFCGNCIAACPTGTLISKPFKFRARPWALKTSESVCPFCPVGCPIEYHTRNNRVERVTSDENSHNEGNLCINGRFGYSYLNSGERLISPLLRDGGRLVQVDWNRATQEAVAGLRRIKEVYGPDAVAGIASPRVTNEESFLFRTMMREVIGSANLDSEARFGYDMAMGKMMERLGISAASAPMDGIDSAQALLVIGCDLNAEATGLEYRVIRAATKGDAPLVLANMRDVKLKKYSSSHLKYRPGGEIALLNGLVKAILDQGVPRDLAARIGVGAVEELYAGMASSNVEGLAASAGVAVHELEEAARLMAGGKRPAIIFGADIIRSSRADEAMDAVINLAIVTGAADVGGGGIYPIYDKNNIMGMLDMGCVPHPTAGIKDNTGSGRDLWQIVDGMEKGEIKALYVLASDLLSFPDNNRIRKALEKLEFLLVQDIFPTETARMAHMVLPGAAAAEKGGTFTTIDNRIQTLSPAVAPPGEAKPDLAIIAELCNGLSRGAVVASMDEVRRGIAKDIPGYGGIEGLLAGSCRDKLKDDGKQIEASLKAALPYPVDPCQGEYGGFTLLVGPILYHSGTTTTWSSNNLTVSSGGYVEIFSADAMRLGISEGMMIKVSSSRGSMTASARPTPRLQPGLLFSPAHFQEVNASSLLEGNCNRVKVEVSKA